MKEGSEGDVLPLSLSKKDTGNNASNQTTSPNLIPPVLTSTSPYLTSATLGQVVGATLAVIGTDVAAGEVVGAHTDADSPTADNNGGGLLPRVSKDTGASPRDKVFVCSVCNRCFGYKHVLQNHERTHTGEKPFECKECHKRFTRDHHLKTHMRLHTGEKPYHCTHCERQFVQVANLRRHLRVHTGERPYACDLCSSRFSDSNQLKAHMLIHKGEKPFECKLCMGRFRRRHHLMHHKCPKEESNLGKPRRGRRSKASDDVDQETNRPLPTVVPVERPKRERKPRETRRIIKVNIPSIMTIGEGSCYPMTSPFSSCPPPPISPPEQTEPEDLSMHSNDNGDRMKSSQLPPRPSSVPISLGGTAGAHHQPLSLRARTPPGRGGNREDRGGHRLRTRVVMSSIERTDDGGSESEAMVEEEEEDEDQDEEEDEQHGHLMPPHRRVRGFLGRDNNLDDDMEEEDEEELMSEGLVEGEDALDEDLADDDDDDVGQIGVSGHLMEQATDAENGGSISSHPKKSRCCQQSPLPPPPPSQHHHHQHPHYHSQHHHHPPHHHQLQYHYPPHHLQQHHLVQHRHAPHHHHPHHPTLPGVPHSMPPVNLGTSARPGVVTSTSVISQGPPASSGGILMAPLSLQAVFKKEPGMDDENGEGHRS